MILKLKNKYSNEPSVFELVQNVLFLCQELKIKNVRWRPFCLILITHFTMD